MMTRTRITELLAETTLVVYSTGFLAWYIAAKLVHLIAMEGWSGL
jgi:hypothetical protein